MKQEKEGPTSHEIEVLEMLDGKREATWGAWVGACLEFLSGRGLCTRGPKYQITEKGRQALASLPRHSDKGADN